MSFDDLGSRFKKARQKDEPLKRPFDVGESYRLRAKMLGVLIRDARLAAARTTEDCARLLRVEPHVMEAWEYGDSSPDMPQLELLAYYLEVPISHFCGQTLIGEDRASKQDLQDEYLQLRHRMIGALLRQAREEANLTVPQVATLSHISEEAIMAYELGTPIPMHQLTVLSNAVNKNMDYFSEAHSSIGELLVIREEWKRFTNLDDDVREFAANPLNFVFIKIAMMFSKLPPDQLRQAAEGLLEIAM